MEKPETETTRDKIEKPVGELRHLRLLMARGRWLDSLWNDLVGKYHYLGYRRLLGRRLKYLAFSDDQPLAAFSWSAAALKLHVRDRYIGWSDVQRKRHLDRIACNSRFLILPWVRSRNLASRLLSLNIGRLRSDWKNEFGIDLLFLETFVDPRYYAGTCYKAANWKHLGQTGGYGKQGKGYAYHGKLKDVYVYVLEPGFREVIGCRKKPRDPFRRPPKHLGKMEELKMLLEHCRWNPKLAPVMDLTEKDMEKMSEELVEFHETFHDYYGRKEHRRLGLAYLSGLMSDAESKSCEPIALELLGSSHVRSLQSFMKVYLWDHDAMQSAHQRMLSELIADAGGMMTVDSSEFVKKGKESVGVARQYCGTLGKVENCQSGVFLGYSSDKGCGIVASRLYMPKRWFSEEYEERRRKTMVPEDLEFRTKPQIAKQLINEVARSGFFPAKWLGCDATFGSDTIFLKSLPSNLNYFAAVKSDTRVFEEKPEVGILPYKGRGRKPSKSQVLPGEPKPVQVKDLVGRMKFKPVVFSEDSKGPVTGKAAMKRVYRSLDGLPDGESLWLFARLDGNGKTKFALSNAPEDISLEELCEASIMRWPIEQCFREGKDQVGMGHYEHRSWPAWHRHMIFVSLALHFLLRLRIKYKKKPRA